MKVNFYLLIIKTFERKTNFNSSPDCNGILFIFSRKNKKIEWKAGQVLKEAQLFLLLTKVLLLS